MSDDWSIAANMAQGRPARGGRITVGQKMLSFRPHVLDRMMGGKTVDYRLSEIVEVGVAERNGEPFSGGLHQRLRVVVRDGTELLFVVRHVDRVAAIVNELVLARTHRENSDDGASPLVD